MDIITLTSFHEPESALSGVMHSMGVWLQNQWRMGAMAHFSGISRYPDGSLFNLYGSFTNFNYARYNYMDVVRPAIIGDWSGSRARSRGMGNVMNNDGTAKGIAKLCT